MKKLSIILLTINFVIVKSSTEQISLFKCCKLNEEISRNVADNYATCIPSNSSWNPLYFDRNSPPISRGLPKSWKIIENTKPVCSDDNEIQVIHDRPSIPIVILSNGGVVVGQGISVFQPNTFCADVNVLLACGPKKVNAAATLPRRIHRCCGDNAVFSDKRNGCVNLGLNKTNKEDTSTLLPKNATSEIELLEGFPSCHTIDPPKYVIIGDTNEGILQSDGGLKIASINLPPLQYCVERIKEFDGKGKVFACSEHAPRRSTIKDSRFILYPVSFLISAIFLAATLAAGWLLPASHHVLHWRCQTHHVVCLMFGDLLMAIIQLWSDSLPAGSCKAIAIMTHFFFLATFFWLNTMCFNIWWTFRDLRPASLEKGQETLRLRVYACYAWGGPFLVAGFAALLDYLPPQQNYTFPRPQFGEDKCWFSGEQSIFAYFYGPIGILLAINVLFFVATARELTCGLWKGDFVKSTTERAALGRVCLKLVVVMGVTWGFDVISWATGGGNIWIVTDLLNALQGLFIFMVVGWQPQVRAGLKRLFNKNPRTNAGRQGNGLSTTSHGMPSMGDSVTQNPSTKTAPLETIC